MSFKLPKLKIKDKFFDNSLDSRKLKRYIVDNSAAVKLKNKDIDLIIQKSESLPGTLSFYKYFFKELLGESNYVCDSINMFSSKTKFRPSFYRNKFLYSFLDKFTNIAVLENSLIEELRRMEKEGIKMELTYYGNINMLYLVGEKLSKEMWGKFIMKDIDGQVLSVREKGGPLDKYYKQKYIKRGALENFISLINNNG